MESAGSSGFTTMSLAFVTSSRHYLAIIQSNLITERLEPRYNRHERWINGERIVTRDISGHSVQYTAEAVDSGPPSSVLSH